MSSLKDTLDSVDWLKTHEDQLRSLLPVEWTPPRPEIVMRIGFGLKVNGVMWSNYDVDLPKIMARLQAIGIMQTKIRRLVFEGQILEAIRCNPYKISEMRWKDLRERERYATVPDGEPITEKAYLTAVRALNKARHESR